MTNQSSEAYSGLHEAIGNRVDFFNRDLIEQLKQPYDKDRQSVIARIATGGFRNNIDIMRNPTDDKAHPEITLSEYGHEPRYFKLVIIENYAKNLNIPREQKERLAKHANDKGELLVETNRYGIHPQNAAQNDLSLPQLLHDIVLDKTSSDYWDKIRRNKDQGVGTDIEATPTTQRDELLDIAAPYHPSFINNEE